MPMYPLAIAKVSAALGGTRALGARIRTIEQLVAAVARGLPRSVVPQLSAHAAPDNAELRRRVAALVVSPATYKRNRRLSPAASERAERLARVTALAQQALGDAGEAKLWLTDAHPLLGNHAPIEVAATDLGARQVERILHNIEHNLPV
jgi:putative toxin-antitoxin system antitoxin component (TIGR02293 family)